MATARWFIGEAHRAEGDELSAAKSLGAGLRLYRRTGDRLGMSGCLAGIACLLTMRREWHDAARYFGAASALRERTQSLLPPTHEAEHERVAAAVLTAIGTAEYEEGQTLDPVVVIDGALARPDALAAGRNTPGQSRGNRPDLTRVQKEVLMLVVGGYDPKEIAKLRKRKLSTIYQHLKQLRDAFDCQTDAALRVKAEPLVRSGFISD
jgi:DNA-binding CsgD family transcriptional regulator